MTEILCGFVIWGIVCFILGYMFSRKLFALMFMHILGKNGFTTEQTVMLLEDTFLDHYSICDNNYLDEMLVELSKTKTGQ